MIFKYVLLAVALAAILKTYRLFKAKKQSLYWFTISTIFWLIVIFVAFLPQTTDIVARYVGVERGADLLVYMAVVVLSYGFYRVMVQQETARKEMTSLVRKLAILEAKKGLDRKER